jgi:hypothetical protein
MSLVYFRYFKNLSEDGHPEIAIKLVPLAKIESIVPETFPGRPEVKSLLMTTNDQKRVAHYMPDTVEEIVNRLSHQHLITLCDKVAPVCPDTSAREIPAVTQSL